MRWFKLLMKNGCRNHLKIQKKIKLKLSQNNLILSNQHKNNKSKYAKVQYKNVIEKP